MNLNNFNKPLPTACIQNFSLSVTGLIRSVFITLAAVGLQWLIWPYVLPHPWLLLYPAVFLSAILGGVIGGLFSVALSLGLISFFFLPVENDNSHYWYSVSLFAAMGVLISVVYQRLSNANCQLQQDLLEQQDRLNFALQAADVGLWEWKPGLNQVLWSDSIWWLYGLEPGSCDPTFDSWAASIDADCRDDVLQQLNRAVDTKQNIRLEWQVANRPVGMERWLVSRGRPVLDARGNLLTYRGMVIDVTERKRAELALRNSENRFRSVIEAATDAIYVKDLMGRYQLVNQAVSRFVGKTTAEIIGQDDTQLLSSEEALTVMASDRKIIETGKVQTLEELVTSADGKRKCFYSSKGPIRDAENNVIGLFGIARDITQLKKLEMSLTASELKLRLFIEHAPAALAMLDRELRYLTYSRRWLQDYGLDEELIGKSHYQMFPEMSAPWKKAYQRALAGEILSGDEDYFVKHDGSIQWQRWEMHPWLNPYGEIGGIVVFSEDITERKQTEIRLLGEIAARQAKEIETEQLKRFYVALSQINEMLLQVKSRQEVFDQICRILVETAQIGLAWIGWLDPETQRLTPVSSCGDNSNYLDDIIVYANADHPEGRGPAGIAYRENRIFICPDFATSELTSPWRDKAEQAGWACSASLPIQLQGKINGVLTLYTSRPNAFKADETALLEKAARNISFALDVLQQEVARQTAETSVANVANRYHKLLATTRDGFLEVDVNTLRLLEVNNAACTMNGYSRTELLSMQVNDLDAQLSKPEIEKIIAKLMKSGWEVFETQHHTKDHRVIDVEVSAMLLANNQSIIAFVRDISSRKHTEQLIWEAKERLEVAASAGIIGIWDWHVPEDILIWDNVICQLYGIKPAEFGGVYQAWFQAIHPDDKAYVECEIQAALSGEREYASEFRVVWPDGSHHYLKAESRTTFDKQGKPLRMIGINYDQTAQKLIEFGLEQRIADRTAKLEQSNQQLTLTQFAMEQVGFGIYWVDMRSGRLIQANQSAANLLGYTPHELLQMQLTDIIPVNEIQPLTELNLTSTSLQTHVCLETLMATRDGRIIPVEMLAFQFYGEDDAPQMITFVTDISLRKQQENALRQAKNAADLANQAKSAFLSNMSHEIRTPMNAIIGLTQILQSEHPSLAQAVKLQKIDDASRHLLAIINDILDLSKIEAGRVELEHLDFQLDTVMAHVRAMIAEQAKAKQLTVYLDEGAVPKWIKGDATRLRQALLNFAGNAVKFTNHGSVTLRCLLVNEDERGVLLIRFEVQDTGPGVPAEIQSRLFQDFEQADTTTTRKYGGTGLGLAITQRLAKMMGGSVGVESKLGQGSTFWFTAKLERGQASDIMHTIDTPQIDAMTELQTKHTGARMLLAEDDLINQEIAVKILSDAGLCVDVANNGQQAVEKAQVGRYDLVLMDMQMPELDGLQATRRIREQTDLINIPIIAMTANAFDTDQRACLDAGMNDFLTKPVDRNKLYATLLKWLPACNPKSYPPTNQPQPADQETELMYWLNAIPGLDVPTGLARLNGNMDFYLRILGTLTSSLQEYMAEISQALADGNLTELGHLAHTIKGACSNINANRVSELANTLDLAIRSDQESDTIVSDCLALTTEMSALAMAITAVLDKINQGFIANETKE